MEHYIVSETYLMDLKKWVEKFFLIPKDKYDHHLLLFFLTSKQKLFACY